MATAQVAQPTDALQARLALLAKEKAITRQLDELAAERRALPLIEITKPYTFASYNPTTKTTSHLTLTDLFSNRRQLIIYHFMFSPDWTAGCTGCSLVGDHIPPLDHLHSRNTSFVAVSRAPVEKLAAYAEKMSWTFPWVSTCITDPTTGETRDNGFNYDFHATLDPAVAPASYNYRSDEDMEAKGQTVFRRGDQPGLSCFILGPSSDDGTKLSPHHTYSQYARGLEDKIPTFAWLDLTRLGRNDAHLKVKMFPRRYEYAEEDLRGDVNGV